VAGDAIERVVDRYEALMHRLIEGHAPEFTEVGVTMAQAKVLYVLAAAGELVDRLVDLGLLRRHSDEADRRQVVVTTTPAAIELLERFRELNQRQLRELLGRLDAGELAAVDRSIEILAQAVDRTATANGATPNATTPQHRENRS